MDTFNKNVSIIKPRFIFVRIDLITHSATWWTAVQKPYKRIDNLDIVSTAIILKQRYTLPTELLM